MKVSVVSILFAVASTPFVLAQSDESFEVEKRTQLQQRAPIAFVMDCAGSNGKKGAGETCNTACYGVNCKFHTNTYDFDAPTDKTKSTRRKRAGCTNGKGKNKNPCKSNRSGNSCDEFPFASTKDADTKQQFYRCVPGTDNQSQGGQLGNLAKNICNNHACQFTLGFKGEANYQYCRKNPSCTNDGNLWTKGNKPLRRDLLADDEVDIQPRSTGGYYKLRSGETFYSPSDLEIGSRAFHYARNETIDAELETRDMDDEEYWGARQLIEDEIVEKM
ncbi:hypothetical protein F5Y13DRAFT_189809 [Hypoxylon sp. FL1857]|nr:hypothetical protein F5Y13DRAFT_189809 [Hypoxylon sp. FL1857]